jgi:hypothetical protein
LDGPVAFTEETRRLDRGCNQDELLPRIVAFSELNGSPF